MKEKGDLRSTSIASQQEDQHVRIFFPSLAKLQNFSGVFLDVDPLEQGVHKCNVTEQRKRVVGVLGWNSEDSARSFFPDLRHASRERLKLILFVRVQNVRVSQTYDKKVRLTGLRYLFISTSQHKKITLTHSSSICPRSHVSFKPTGGLSSDFYTIHTIRGMHMCMSGCN